LNNCLNKLKHITPKKKQKWVCIYISIKKLKYEMVITFSFSWEKNQRMINWSLHHCLQLWIDSLTSFQWNSHSLNYSYSRFVLIEDDLKHTFNTYKYQRWTKSNSKERECVCMRLCEEKLRVCAFVCLMCVCVCMCANLLCQAVQCQVDWDRSLVFVFFSIVMRSENN
jgi:hypothetical protein